MPFKPGQMLESLREHRVEFVTVGGLAARFHGATRSTEDLDLVPAWTPSNLERVCEWLRSIDAAARTGAAASGDQIVPALLIEREVVNWTTIHGNVDTLFAIPDRHGNPVTFDQLLEHATAVRVDGHRVAIASLHDIIESKAFAGRRKDAQALPELHRLVEKQQPITDVNLSLDIEL